MSRNMSTMLRKEVAVEIVNFLPIRRYDSRPENELHASQVNHSNKVFRRHVQLIASAGMQA